MPPLADLEDCSRLLANGSRSFHAASYLLPSGMRMGATALYAWCREADDAIDHAPPERRDQVVTALHEKLRASYAGRVTDSATERAFAWVTRSCNIPLQLPHALIEGFAWDAEVRRYRSIEDLHAYGARVAGSVGAMMSLVMGVRSPKALARACDLGVAMQLTNIARDVGEDARMGRVYLPLNWCQEADVDVEALIAHPEYSQGLGEVVERLLKEADRLYERSMPGIAMLPFSARPAMHAARALYAEIGQEVRRRQHDSVSTRAVVTPQRKMRVLSGALLACLASAEEAAAEPLEATRHLVEAAAEGLFAPEPMPAFDGRIHWLVDLFTRLERGEAEMARGPGAAAD